LSIHYIGGWTNNYLQSGNLPLGAKLEVTTSYFAGVVLLTLAGFIVILWAHAQRNHTWHIVTNQRVWVKTGIFSTQDLADLEYNKINNIKQKKPYPIKQFDVGHIELYTAASDGAEVTMHYIKNPEKWKREIRSHIADKDDQIDE
jgi:hypothetical protein